MNEALFFALLRKALWDSDETLPRSIAAEEVEDIIGAAQKSAVAGLIANAIIDNNINVGPDWPTKLTAISVLLKITNQKIDKGVAELVKLMNGCGEEYIIVKGQTLAPLYRLRQARTPGDTDFVVKDYLKATKTLREEWGIKLPKKIFDKEVSFTYNENIYELHTRLVSFGRKKHRQHWERFIAASPKATIEVDGTEVATLAPTQYALYVFVHLFFHFIDEGIGMRHLCDWAVVLQKWEKEIDHRMLHETLRALEMEKAFCAFGSIIVSKLGVTAFPWEITDEDRREGEIILNDILSIGNFGTSKRETKSGKWRYKLETTRLLLKNCVKYYRLAPSEIALIIPRLVRYNLRIIIGC